MVKQRARSRLSSSANPRIRAKSTTSRLVNDHQEVINNFKKRLNHTPLLLIASGFYLAAFWLITTYHPEQLRNLILANSFLPFHLLVLLANFFLLTFVTLSRRWAIMIALPIQWLLILVLQNFTLDLWTGLSALAIGIVSFFTYNT